MTDLITAHIAHLTAEGFAETTVTHAEKFLRRLDRELPMGLEQSVEQEIVAWLNRCRCCGRPAADHVGEEHRYLPHARQTRASYLGHIHRCLRFGTDPRRTSGPRLSFDASAGIKRPRVRAGLPRPVKEPHLSRILDGADEPFRTAAWIAYRAGLRCCELVQLDTDTGDVNEAYIRVRGKGGKDRVIRTHPDLRPILAEMPGGPVIRRPDGDQADAQWLSITAARHFRFRLWLPAGVSMHALRHTFATELYANGVDIGKIQKLMGHDSIQSTMIYTYVTDEQCDDAITTLPARRRTPN